MNFMKNKKNLFINALFCSLMIVLVDFLLKSFNINLNYAIRIIIKSVILFIGLNILNKWYKNN